jgi:hypothetical protein
MSSLAGFALNDFLVLVPYSLSIRITHTSNMIMITFISTRPHMATSAKVTELSACFSVLFQIVGAWSPSKMLSQSNHEICFLKAQKASQTAGHY